MGNNQQSEKAAFEIKDVIGGSITISALLAGFVLIFIGLILADAKEPSWLQLTTLFFAVMLFEFFYRAMVKGWNLMAVRTMADIGDQILEGKITKGPDYAAFRSLWVFQPKLYQGSWLILIVMVLYGASKSWWNVLPIMAGFLTGLVFYSVLAERSWIRTWQRCSAWDRLIYLGESERAEHIRWHQRLFMKISAFK